MTDASEADEARRHLIEALSGMPRKPAKRAPKSSAAKPTAAAKTIIKRNATSPTRRYSR